MFIEPERCENVISYLNSMLFYRRCQRFVYMKWPWGIPLCAHCFAAKKASEQARTNSKPIDAESYYEQKAWDDFQQLQKDVKKYLNPSKPAHLMHK